MRRSFLNTVSILLIATVFGCETSDRGETETDLWPVIERAGFVPYSYSRSLGRVAEQRTWSADRWSRGGWWPDRPR